MGKLEDKIREILKPNVSRQCPQCSFKSKFSHSGIETHLRKKHNEPKRITKLVNLFNLELLSYRREIEKEIEKKMIDQEIETDVGLISAKSITKQDWDELKINSQ